MKITNNTLSYKGIAPPYKKEGFKITPIAQNPEISDIKKAIAACETQEAHEGLNGRAYFFGEDLVVKKYMPENVAANYDPEREIKAFDSMWEKDVSGKNIQKGLYAFETPDGEKYAVSTRIKGARLNSVSNKCTPDNLQSIVDLIGQLDMPRKTGKGFFPYEVPMHYDLTTGNLLISKDDAGIIDFENLKFENLDKKIYRQFLGLWEVHCDFSDIAGIPSNLRNFEYKTLSDYLEEQNCNEARLLFDEYLHIKSGYHRKRGEFYSKEAKKAYEAGEEETGVLCSRFMQKEFAHACMLENLDKKIILAEAIKIQIARFIFTQSPYAQSGKEEVNIKQINNYLKRAQDFFEKNLHNSSGEKEKIYWQDCLDLMNNWRELGQWMDYQKRCVESMPKKKAERNKYISEHGHEAEVARIFGAKLTDKYQETLEGHLHLSW